MRAHWPHSSDHMQNYQDLSYERTLRSSLNIVIYDREKKLTWKNNTKKKISYVEWIWLLSSSHSNNNDKKRRGRLCGINWKSALNSHNHHHLNHIRNALYSPWHVLWKQHEYWISDFSLSSSHNINDSVLTSVVIRQIKPPPRAHSLSYFSIILLEVCLIGAAWQSSWVGLH